jgi:uncharacterized membrane protein
MEFWPLLLLILGFIIASLILPWVLLGRIGALRLEIEALRRELTKRPVSAPAPLPASSLDEEKPWAVIQPSDVRTAARDVEPPRDPEEVGATDAASEATRQAPPSPPLEPAPAARPVLGGDLEQQLGGRVAVWTGGVALALSGLFLIKYSIDTGLLTETVRVVLGCIFGAVLLGAGSWIRSRPSIANGVRIAQALSGAGVAVLYISLYAATSLYDLLPPTIGFMALAAVTAIAVALSVLHGPPIAVLGLAGGFLTPALVETDTPSAAGLFLYLSLLVAGIMAVIRAKAWDWLAWPTLIGALIWVGLWLIRDGDFGVSDSFWIAFFLAVLSAAVVIGFSKGEGSADDRPLSGSRNYLRTLTLSLALVTMGLTVNRADFGLGEWAFFGLISAGCLALAYFKPRLYAQVPWVSAIVSAVLLWLWTPEQLSSLFGVLIAFAALHVVSGYVFLWRSPAPHLWAALAGVSAIGFFVIAYFRLRYAAFLSPLPFVWGLAAMILAAAAVVALRQVMERLAVEGRLKDYALAAFAATASAFVSVGLGIELERDFLPVAFAAEVLALAWIMTRIEVPGLRQIAIVVAIVFTVLLAPQLLLLLQLAIFSLTQVDMGFQRTPPIVAWPLFQLGLPAIFLGTASVLLRQKRDDVAVRCFEAGAVALLGVMAYYVTRHLFHAPEDVLFVVGSFSERAVTTNILYLFGLAVLWVGTHFSRRAIVLSALAVLGIAAFRTVVFDLLRDNPLFTSQDVGTMPILNAIVLAYVLPALWIEAAVRLARNELPEYWADWLQRLAFFLLFVAATLETRHIFHPVDMSEPGLAGAEVYAYSIVWLAMALAVLFIGTLMKSRTLRIASLALMVLTVSKVFLYDASELTGLYRVLSFLGLGISLLGLGYFYRRFIFTDASGEPKPA